MPGGRNAVGGGIRETDDGTGAFILGEASGSDSVHGLQGGVWDRVDGGTHAATTWEGSGRETALGSHIPWWGATYLQDGLSDLRETKKLPH